MAAAMADRAQHLSHLEFLGDAVRFTEQIHALIPKCSLLENFSPAEVRRFLPEGGANSTARFRRALRLTPGRHSANSRSRL